MSATMVNIVEKYGNENLVVWDGGRMVKYHAIIRMLLRSIHAIHQILRRPKLPTSNLKKRRLEF